MRACVKGVLDSERVMSWVDIICMRTCLGVGRTQPIDRLGTDTQQRAG